MTHRKVHKAHSEYESNLSLNERFGVFVTKRVGTMICAYVFTAIGVGSLVGVVTNNTTLALVCGALSSYVIQLVLLPVIMVGQDVEGRKNEHVLSEVLSDLEALHENFADMHDTLEQVDQDTQSKLDELLEMSGNIHESVKKKTTKKK